MCESFYVCVCVCSCVFVCVSVCEYVCVSVCLCKFCILHSEWWYIYIYIPYLANLGSKWKLHQHMREWCPCLLFLFEPITWRHHSALTTWRHHLIESTDEQMSSCHADVDEAYKWLSLSVYKANPYGKWIYTYKCIYIYEHTHTHPHMRARMHTHAHARTCTHKHTHTQSCCVHCGLS